MKITKQITIRDTQSLDKYLDEIAKIKLITAEEEVSLARRIHKGDLEARDCLINANLRFVISVAKQYQNRGLSLADLINEGNLGLIEAAQRFDETRGFKFISYAVWWIRQAIIYAVAKHTRIVRLPLNRINHINKIKKSIADLEQKYEREPTILEITQSLELTPTDVTVAIKNTGLHISMDTPFVQGEEWNMHDVLLNEDESTPDKELLMDSLRKDVERALNKLTPREADIIRFYFGLNGRHAHTLTEISEEFNLTIERIRQIKAKSINKIKHTTICRILKTYLS
ncbi:MAG TPA: RNA polymerase sigma factor RpoD/SigA [Bacteroidales bacterium]|nr:RNA polymerase sigma factor RpoD/SigA [Bacteroidales bacterium]